MEERLLVYLVMSLAYMFPALKACDIIKEDPESNKPWIVALPSLILTVLLVVMTLRDLFFYVAAH